MNKRTITIVATALAVAVTMKPADAQLGKLLREGAKHSGKQAAKVVKEGGQSVPEGWLKVTVILLQKPLERSERPVVKRLENRLLSSQGKHWQSPG